MSATIIHTGPLTTAQVQQYHREGFLVVPGLYHADQMLQWKATLQKHLEADRQAGNTLRSGVRVWMVPQFPPELLDAMRDEKVLSILRQLIGPNIEFLSAKAVFKNAATTFASPWHQDWFYWGGATKASVWIALDDATPDNGCLQFAVGSHTRVFQRDSHRGQEFSERIDEALLKGYEVRSVPARRGDAVFFHDLAAHSSHPNTSGGDRWSFISTYRDGSVKDDSTVWKRSLVVSGKSASPTACP